MISNILIIIAIFIAFYFFVVRPLQKKYGHGTYPQEEMRSSSAQNENGLHFIEDPTDPRSKFNTKEW